MKEVQPTTASRPSTVDLGQHTLEVLEEQAILIVDHMQGTEAIRLDSDETYKLLLALRELFK
jgi:hypothetical protein